MQQNMKSGAKKAGSCRSKIILINWNITNVNQTFRGWKYWQKITGWQTKHRFAPNSMQATRKAHLQYRAGRQILMGGCFLNMEYVLMFASRIHLLKSGSNDDLFSPITFTVIDHFFSDVWFNYGLGRLSVRFFLKL